MLFELFSSTPFPLYSINFNQGQTFFSRPTSYSTSKHLVIFSNQRQYCFIRLKKIELQYNNGISGDETKKIQGQRSVNDEQSTCVYFSKGVLKHTLYVLANPFLCFCKNINSNFGIIFVRRLCHGFMPMTVEKWRRIG